MARKGWHDGRVGGGDGRASGVAALRSGTNNAQWIDQKIKWPTTEAVALHSDGAQGSRNEGRGRRVSTAIDMERECECMP